MAFAVASTLGLDIGTTGMRAVEVSWRNGAPVVERWGALDFEFPIKNWADANLSEMSQQLQALVAECGFRSKMVAHSVSGKAVVPQYFNFPQLMPEDVPDAVGRAGEHDAPRVDDQRPPTGAHARRVLADLVGGDHERLLLDRARLKTAPISQGKNHYNNNPNESLKQ